MQQTLCYLLHLKRIYLVEATYWRENHWRAREQLYEQKILHVINVVVLIECQGIDLHSIHKIEKLIVRLLIFSKVMAEPPPHLFQNKVDQEN